MAGQGEKVVLSFTIIFMPYICGP